MTQARLVPISLPDFGEPTVEPLLGPDIYVPFWLSPHLAMALV
jgi:hypothetical protein